MIERQAYLDCKVVLRAIDARRKLEKVIRYIGMHRPTSDESVGNVVHEIVRLVEIMQRADKRRYT
jgi:hypothetical protein